MSALSSRLADLENRKGINDAARSGNEKDRTVQDALIEPGKPSGLPGFIATRLDILACSIRLAQTSSTTS